MYIVDACQNWWAMMPHSFGMQKMTKQKQHNGVRVCELCVLAYHLPPSKLMKQIHANWLIQVHTTYLLLLLFFRFCLPSLSFRWLSGSVHPMVTVTPSPLAGLALQPPPRRSAESSPSHSHSHSHSQMSRNSSRKSNNSVNCKIDGKPFSILHEIDSNNFAPLHSIAQEKKSS